MRKRFSRSLHGTYDVIAREVTMHCMERMGYKMRENPNIYAQDLIAQKGDNKFYVECEVKTVWTGVRVSSSQHQPCSSYGIKI